MNGERRARNTQACCVCRHKRKRCSPDCEMARYFPGTRYTEFENAHKLFGMRNITKIMNSVPERLKSETADSIFTAGNARANDPVRGLQGIVSDLQAQIHGCEAELQVINSLRDIERRKQLQRVTDGSSSSSMPPTPPAFKYGSDDDFQPPPQSSAEVQPTIDPYQSGVSGEHQAMEVDNNNEEDKSSSSKKGKKPMGI